MKFVTSADGLTQGRSLFSGPVLRWILVSVSIPGLNLSSRFVVDIIYDKLYHIKDVFFFFIFKHDRQSARMNIEGRLWSRS